MNSAVAPYRGVALELLTAHPMTRIWDGMVVGIAPGLTLRQTGGVGGALAGKAQAIYDALSGPEQATARRAFVRLVQMGEGTRDTRRRLPITALCGRDERPEQVLSVLWTCPDLVDTSPQSK